MIIRITATEATMDGKPFNFNDKKEKAWLAIYIKRRLFGGVLHD